MKWILTISPKDWSKANSNDRRWHCLQTTSFQPKGSNSLLLFAEVVLIFDAMMHVMLSVLMIYFSDTSSCTFVAVGKNLLYFLYVLEFFGFFLNNKTLKAYFIVLWIYLGRQSCLLDRVPKPHWNQEDVVTLVTALSWGSRIFPRESEMSKVARKRGGGFLI